MIRSEYGIEYTTELCCVDNKLFKWKVNLIECDSWRGCFVEDVRYFVSESDAKKYVSAFNRAETDDCSEYFWRAEYVGTF